MAGKPLGGLPIRNRVAIRDPRDQTRRTRRDFSLRLWMARILPPEQYAKAVSNADIRAVNNYKVLYSVVKRERGDGSG